MFPVSVIVSHKESRESFFKGFCLPSIMANRAEEVLVMDKPVPTPAIVHNEGFRRSKCPYILHTNDDYILRADCVEKMWSALEGAPGAAFVISDCAYVTMPDAPLGVDPPTWHFKPREIRKEMLEKSMCDISWMVRREAHPLFDESLELKNLHDLDFFYNILNSGGTWAQVQEILFWVCTIDPGIFFTMDLGVSIRRVRAKYPRLFGNPQ